MRKIAVVPFNPNWNKLFQREEQSLAALFGSLATGIHHIGSTSIPNMSAKPIIDIMIEVLDIHEVDEYNTHIEELGYTVRGENGIESRRFFHKGGDNRTHHVHIFQKGNADIIRHIAFRDYLITNAEKAKQYKELKERLASEYPNNIDHYMEGKGPWIKQVEQEALDWYKNTLSE